MKKTEKIILYIIVIALLVTSLYLFIQTNYSYRVFTQPDEIAKVIKQKSPRDIIIDLRDEKDYEKQHIASSINLPLDDDGTFMLSYLEKKKYYNKNLYLICYSGNRAGKGFNILVKHQFKHVTYLKYGFDEYKKSMGDSGSYEEGECACKKDA